MGKIVRQSSPYGPIWQDHGLEFFHEEVYPSLLLLPPAGFREGPENAVDNALAIDSHCKCADAHRQHVSFAVANGQPHARYMALFQYAVEGAQAFLVGPRRMESSEMHAGYLVDRAFQKEGRRPVCREYPAACGVSDKDCVADRVKALQMGGLELFCEPLGLFSGIHLHKELLVSLYELAG